MLNEVVRSTAAELVRTLVVVAEGRTPDKFSVTGLASDPNIFGGGIMVGRQRERLDTFLQRQIIRDRRGVLDCPDFGTFTSPEFRQRLVDGLGRQALMVFHGGRVDLASLPEDIRRQGHVEQGLERVNLLPGRFADLMGEGYGWILAPFPVLALPVPTTTLRLNMLNLSYSNR